MGSVAPKSYPVPLEPSGALDGFKHDDYTPVVGREYPTVNIVDDILNATNADERIRELGITLARRGVVFFRAQDNLTNELQKTLIQRLGELTGKPAESSLHIHPILNDKLEFGVGDAQISTISSSHRKQLSEKESRTAKFKSGAKLWHSDLQSERVPPDFSSLRLTQLPSNGGDTLWASGYELYEKFSTPFQKMLDGLTATYVADGVLYDKNSMYSGARGHPKNIGSDFSAVHPVIRTHPVTGWKSIYSVGPFPKYINELSGEESQVILRMFLDTLTQNHDLQLRFKWRSVNDIAIWDNRCTFHAPTYDYDHLGERAGNRAVGIAEEPYFDPNSVSISEGLRGKQ